MVNVGDFLAMFFGCHQKPERSFHFRDKQFPICARCTGMLIGIIIGAITYFFVGLINIFIVLLLFIPGVIDGTIQLKTKYESNNIKRLLTGILMGFGFVYLFIYSIWIVYKAGYYFAELLK